jgi:predicted RNA-binding Zn ribbon-like protein
MQPVTNSGGTGDGELRDGFRFRGGSVALDLCGTLGGRLRDVQKELLGEPGDLARWLVAARLATAKVPVSARDLSAFRDLRETIYRLAMAAAAGKPFPDRDRLRLNRFAAAATPAPRLERRGTSWGPAHAQSLRAVIARSAVELFGGPLADRVRQCAGEGCALLFVDTSRSGHRKWCSMAGCGNKAKVATFRERSS